MRKISLILFVIAVVFVSLHVALFLGDLTDVTGAHSLEGREQGFEEPKMPEDFKQTEEINQTETDPYRFL